jgi:ribonuclease H2 subunit A
VREWVLDETADNMHRNFGSGYPGGVKILAHEYIS